MLPDTARPRARSPHAPRYGSATCTLPACSPIRLGHVHAPQFGSAACVRGVARLLPMPRRREGSTRMRDDLVGHLEAAMRRSSTTCIGRQLRPRRGLSGCVRGRFPAHASRLFSHTASCRFSSTACAPAHGGLQHRRQNDEGSRMIHDNLVPRRSGDRGEALAHDPHMLSEAGRGMNRQAACTA